MQLNTKINEVQKAIGQKKKAKENADDLLAQKGDLEKEKKSFLDAAAEKDAALKAKLGTIGNLVHESVPVEQNEVWLYKGTGLQGGELTWNRTSTQFNASGSQKASQSRSEMSSPTTKFLHVWMDMTQNVVSRLSVTAVIS